MLSPPVRMARDYNRGLLAPIRLAHTLAAALHQSFTDAFPRASLRRQTLLPLLLGLLGFWLVLPYDGPLGAAARAAAADLSGDLRRELFAWQQYGQGFCLAIVAIAIILLDRDRTRRLLDLALAAGLAKLAGSALKALVGRPRPRPEFDDPATFLGPLGKYPVPVPSPGPDQPAWRLTHAWNRSTGGGVDLWAMPSSHTLFAAVLSVFLAALYPRLRPLLIALTLLVAAGRVLFAAHWPTDVIVGGALGVAIAAPITTRYLGVRLIDHLWRTLIDRTAAPALPRVKAVEHARLTPVP